MKMFYLCKKAFALLFLVAAIPSSGKAQAIVSEYAGLGAVGNGNGDGGFAINATFGSISSLLADTSGNLYITAGDRIRKINASGIVSTIAGYGTGGSKSGDGGPATAAKVNKPVGMAIDKNNNLYFADAHNNCVRKIDRNGIITTVAGYGGGGFTDDTLAIHALLKNPLYITLDDNNNLYIWDAGNARICKVDQSGFLTTIAGARPGFIAPTNYILENGPATNCKLVSLNGMAVLPNGDLIFASKYLHVIRKVSPDGIISTIAGNWTAQSAGDSGPAISSATWSPDDLCRDKVGNIYFIEASKGKVRKINYSDGLINTLVSGPYVHLALESDTRFFLGNYSGVIYYTNIAAPVGQENMIVLPNPCNKVSNVVLPSQYQEMATVFVLNTSGRVVSKSVGPTNRNIGLTFEDGGVYIIQATSKHGYWGGKVSVISPQ